MLGQRNRELGQRWLWEQCQTWPGIPGEVSADLAVKALVESFEKEEGKGGQPAGSSTGCSPKVWESQVYLSP